jgi:hypothetical protein
MFKKLALAMAIGVGVLLAFAATRPNDFRIERSTLIKAPPEKVFALSSVRFILRRQAAMPMLMRAPEDSWVSTI